MSSSSLPMRLKADHLTRSPMNSSAEEIAYSLRIPHVHGMVRAALHRENPHSAKLEAELENGQMVDALHRRAGRAPKKEVEIKSRWEAGKLKVERDGRAMEARREARIKHIMEEREKEVAGDSAEGRRPTS